jgi:hypothetical protein
MLESRTGSVKPLVSGRVRMEPQGTLLPVRASSACGLSGLPHRLAGQLLDPGGQFFYTEGLGEEVVADTLDPVHRLRPAGDDQNRKGGSVRAEAARQGGAVHSRHLGVGDQQVQIDTAGNLERIVARTSPKHSPATCLENRGHEKENQRLVVDDERYRLHKPAIKVGTTPASDLKYEFQTQDTSGGPSGLPHTMHSAAPRRGARRAQGRPTERPRPIGRGLCSSTDWSDQTGASTLLAGSLTLVMSRVMPDMPVVPLPVTVKEKKPLTG